MKVFLVYDIEKKSYRSNTGWSSIDNAKIYPKIGSAKNALHLHQSKNLIIVEANLEINEQQMVKDILDKSK